MLQLKGCGLGTELKTIKKKTVTFEGAGETEVKHSRDLDQLRKVCSQKFKLKSYNSLGIQGPGGNKLRAGISPTGPIRNADEHDLKHGMRRMDTFPGDIEPTATLNNDPARTECRREVFIPTARGDMLIVRRTQ